ncbi:uncharacterized protein LOC130629703 [Hydractinia symbiolongicarpus]|uniref:uncharacterized protein LOC130629703 n=1 Tax=Hydractinia symbiolongicarpus TaxID=13093 RepID=UPI00254A1E4A|nr:uncharacterized protein LOC130629703 [Hydractinia symbiolongicarpus]
MVTCGALNCGNSSTKKSVADVKGWHNVPTEKENKQRRKKWLAAMKRDPPYPADTNFVLCGMHFTSECFQRDLKAELCGSVRKFILLPNAIPSVFSFSKPLPAKRSASIARNERKTKRQIVDEACTAEENSGGPEAPSLELEPLFKDAITQTVDVVMINKEVSCATPMRTKSTMVPAVLCKSMSTQMSPTQKKWLTEESPAYIALEKIVNEKQLLNDLKHVADFKHTGQLEVYNSLLNKYCPKRLAFSYAGMVARTQLAVLDHNSGVERQQATTSDGRLKFKVSFTKITKEWVAKKVMDPKEKKYQEDLMKEVFDLVQKIKAPIFFKLPETPRNIALKINPGKEVVVSNMRSRFT